MARASSDRPPTRPTATLPVELPRAGWAEAFWPAPDMAAAWAPNGLTLDRWTHARASEEPGPLERWCQMAQVDALLAWWGWDEAARRADVAGLLWTPTLSVAARALAEAYALEVVRLKLEHQSVQPLLSPSGAPGPSARLARLVPVLAGLADRGLLDRLAARDPYRPLAALVARHARVMARNTLGDLVLRGYRDDMAQNPHLVRVPALRGPLVRGALADARMVSIPKGPDGDDILLGEYRAELRERWRTLNNLPDQGVATLVHLLDAGWVPSEAQGRSMSALVGRWRDAGYPLERLVGLLTHPSVPPVGDRVFRVLVRTASGMLGERIESGGWSTTHADPEPEVAEWRRRVYESPRMTPALYRLWGRVGSRDGWQPIHEILATPVALADRGVRRMLSDMTGGGAEEVFPLYPPDLYWEAMGRLLTRRAKSVRRGASSLRSMLDGGWALPMLLEGATEAQVAGMPKRVWRRLLRDTGDGSDAVRAWAIGHADRV